MLRKYRDYSQQYHDHCCYGYAFPRFSQVNPGPWDAPVLGVAETDAWNISTDRSLLEVQTLRPGSTGDESESAF